MKRRIQILISIVSVLFLTLATYTTVTNAQVISNNNVLNHKTPDTSIVKRLYEKKTNLEQSTPLLFFLIFYIIHLVTSGSWFPGLGVFQSIINTFEDIADGNWELGTFFNYLFSFAFYLFLLYVVFILDNT